MLGVARVAHLPKLGFLLFFVSLTLPGVVRADGWIRVHRPPATVHAWGGLEVTHHDVKVSIRGGVATVQVDETFHNRFPRDLEGTYYFPIPENAAIEDFRAVLGGEELAGEILPREQAREIYEKLVRDTRDPALLEYYDRGLFRARVYPIPARGDARIKLSYRHVLRRSGGYTRFRYPFDTGRFTAGPYKNVNVVIDIETDEPLRSVRCESHKAKIERMGKTRAQVTLKADKLVADRDVIVDTFTSQDSLAGGILSFREPGEDGFFSLRLAPGDEIPEKLPPQRLVLIVDTSGSMAGDKIRNARASLLAALARLRPEDSFQILTFSSRVASFAPGLVPATPERVQEARDFVAKLTARGGTDIHGALQRALGDVVSETETATLLLVSDGAPTVGVVDPREIVRTISRNNAKDQRIHVFGVGRDVNTMLLDDLARKNGGSRTYLRVSQSLEVAMSGLLDKVLFPCLSDIRVLGSNIEIHSLEPAGSTDLFFGEDLILTGRYVGSGRGSLRVEGTAQRELRTFIFATTFPEHGGDDQAPYLWAQMRILRLLDVLRTATPAGRKELKEEIVSLGLRYGIVTPYTSFLVREGEDYLSRNVRGRIGGSTRAREEMERSAAGYRDATGRNSFDYARRAAELKRRAQQGLLDEPKSAVEQTLGFEKKGGKAFVPMEGRQVDGSLQGRELPKPDLTLIFGSAEYMDFLRQNPAAKRVLSAGRSLIFRWDGKVIQVDDIAPEDAARGESQREREIESF